MCARAAVVLRRAGRFSEYRYRPDITPSHESGMCRRMLPAPADIIVPRWTLVFCKKPGRWWVRLLACGRYNHVKALAYLPTMRAWLFYDVKFNGTRLMLGHDGDHGTRTFLYEYLDNCDTIDMPRLPEPRRRTPHLGFWCTLAMKHLVGISSGALRPDRLWHDCIAAGGTPHEGLSMHRSALIDKLSARMKALRDKNRPPARPLRAFAT